MPIHKADEYDKVVNVSWYTPEKAREELQYSDTAQKTCLRLLIVAAFPVFYPFLKCIPYAVLTYGISLINSTSSLTTISSTPRLLMTL